MFGHRVHVYVLGRSSIFLTAGFMLTHRMLFPCMLLALVSIGLAALPKAIGDQPPAQGEAAKKPFDLTEIKDLLKGGVTPKRVATLVEQYGVSFELTNVIKKALRKLGADNGLLLVISKYRDTTAQDWEAVRGSDDRDRLEAFLQRHPSGQFSDAARAQIEQIDWDEVNGSNDRSQLEAFLDQHNDGNYAQQAREQIEQIDWNSAFSSHDRARIQAYLDQYRGGKYSQQAREALEQIDWESIRDSKDVQRLRAFLNAYPQGRYAASANALIEALVSVQSRANAHARPVQCPLPDKLQFDYNTPQREKIGIWTGQWNVSPVLRFCVVITSIKGHEVRGVYSWADNSKGDFEVFMGKIEVAKFLPGHSQSFPPQIITVKSEAREITLEFRNDGKVQATWRRPGFTSFPEARVTKIK